MPAFVIGEIDVDNPLEYAEHRRLAHATVTKHHGRYLVAGGSAVGLEGDRPSGRIVVIEFPNKDAAKGWYDSPEYQEVVRIRRRTSTCRMYLVEGLLMPL